MCGIPDTCLLVACWARASKALLKPREVIRAGQALSDPGVHPAAAVAAVLLCLQLLQISLELRGQLQLLTAGRQEEKGTKQMFAAATTEHVRADPAEGYLRSGCAPY